MSKKNVSWKDISVEKSVLAYINVLVEEHALSILGEFVLDLTSYQADSSSISHIQSFLR